MNAPLQQVIDVGVSVLAVTLSLLSLAFQVRQQTRALRSQNYAHALGRLAAVLVDLTARRRGVVGGAAGAVQLGIHHARRGPQAATTCRRQASRRWSAFLANSDADPIATGPDPVADRS